MISALVMMNVRRDAINSTAQALLAIPGVAEVYSVTGEYDLLAVLHLARYEDLAEVVTERMLALEAIQRTQTMMAFKAYSREDLEQAWDIAVQRQPGNLTSSPPPARRGAADSRRGGPLRFWRHRGPRFRHRHERPAPRP